MTSIHHYCVIRSSCAALKVPCAFIHAPSPTNLWQPLFLLLFCWFFACLFLLCSLFSLFQNVLMLGSFSTQPFQTGLIL